MPKTGITAQLIDNIIKTRFETFTKELVERARDIVIDIIGCICVGAKDTGCPMILDLIKEWGGNAESTVLVNGFRGPSHNVALANAVMARSYDFGIVDACVEDEFMPTHIGETLVPTALAVAEHKALSGKQLLTSLILGEDLSSRIAFTSTSFGRWDSTGTVNTLGATAVAGKLWGLDNSQWLNAFGIALNQLAGTDENLYEKVHCFKLNQGLAAQRGIFNVRLASKGFTGVNDPLTGNLGYFALYSPDYDPQVLTQFLGKKFYTEVTFKPYPSCRGTHAAIECALEIVHKNQIDVSEIEEASVIVSNNSVPVALREHFNPGTVPHVSAIFSLQYTVANALLRGKPRPEHFSEESIKAPQMFEIMKKVKITAQEFPGESFLAATVEVKMKDGNKFTEHVNVPKGNDIIKPLTKDEKREKFRMNVGFSKKVASKKADEALNMLEKLDEVKDIRKIVSLLVP